jgi:hypothetical protein
MRLRAELHAKTNTPMVTNGEESYSIERRQTTILLNGTKLREAMPTLKICEKREWTLERFCE